MCNEDKRTAIGFSVTLSSQLIAASLAILAIEGAFVVYALDKRVVGALFYLFTVLSCICFICSIYFAGRGVTAARDAGFQGKWNTETSKSLFNNQATLCLIGLLCLIGVLFTVGKPKAQETIMPRKEVEACLHDLNKSIASIGTSCDSMKQQVSVLTTTAGQILGKLDQTYILATQVKDSCADIQVRHAAEAYQAHLNQKLSVVENELSNIMINLDTLERQYQNMGEKIGSKVNIIPEGSNQTLEETR